MKIKTAQTILPISLLFVFSTIFNPVSALAQASLGVTAIPPRLEVTLKPGDIEVKEIKVRNESNGERIMSTTISDFIVNNNTGTPVQIDGTNPKYSKWAASNWITIHSATNRLKGGETKNLQITISVPEDALPGGHYAMILHSPTNDSIISESGASIATYVGTLVYVTVAGDVKQDARVKEFFAPSFSEYGPIDFVTAIENLSDIHITPIGTIDIHNMFGFKTASLKLDETNIFPYVYRDYNNTFPENNNGKKSFLFGRYKASLTAAYGTAGGVLTAYLFFWVLPWRFIIFSVSTIGIIIAIIILIKRNKQNKPVSKDKIEELENELESLKNKYKDTK